MKKTEVLNNGTSVAIKNKQGVIELFPVQTVKAMALQRILGIDRLPRIEVDSNNK